jgi:hypothetical protein
MKNNYLKIMALILVVPAIIVGYTLIINIGTKKSNENITPTTTIIGSTSNLSFYEDVTCQDKIDPYTKPISGIISSEWETTTTLIITIFIKTDCSGVSARGSYEIIDEKIFLNYSKNVGYPNETITSCICTHIYIYKINNLEHKNYQLFIDQKEIRK